MHSCLADAQRSKMLAISDKLYSLPETMLNQLVQILQGSEYPSQSYKERTNYGRYLTVYATCDRKCTLLIANLCTWFLVFFLIRECIKKTNKYCYSIIVGLGTIQKRRDKQVL